MNTDNISQTIMMKAQQKANIAAQKIYSYMNAEIAVCMHQQMMNIQNGKQDRLTSLQIDPKQYISISVDSSQDTVTYTIAVNYDKLNILSQDSKTLFASLFHRAKTRVFAYSM